MNRNRIAVTTTLAAALAVTLLGCTGTPASTSPASPATTAAPRPVTTAAPRPVTMAGARNCPVTIGHPVPSSKPWREGLFGWQHAYGNGSLWVGALWPHGVVIITPDNVDPDGRLEMKFGWYRLTSGFLAITGRRHNGVLVAEEDWRAIQETLYLLSVPGMRAAIPLSRNETSRRAPRRSRWVASSGGDR